MPGRATFGLTYRKKHQICFDLTNVKCVSRRSDSAATYHYNSLYLRNREQNGFEKSLR